MMVLVGLVIYVFIFFKLFTNTYFFRYTIESFKEKRYLYAYFTLYIIIIVAYIVGPRILHPSMHFIICVPCLCALCFTFLIRPFNRFSENLRFSVNIILLTIIVLFRVFVTYYLSSTNETMLVYTLLLVINFILIPLTQIINIIAMVYSIWISFAKKDIECTCSERR